MKLDHRVSGWALVRALLAVLVVQGLACKGGLSGARSDGGPNDRTDTGSAPIGETDASGNPAEGGSEDGALNAEPDAREDPVGGGTANSSPIRLYGTDAELTAVACADATRCLAVGGMGAGVFSTGRNWRTSVVSRPSPRIVIWDGQRFVFAGAFGISTATDASNEKVIASVPEGGVGGLAWSGAHYVAIGAKGVIHTSSDAITWITRPSGTTEALTALAWTGSMFVVLTQEGTILTSPDGTTWTVRSLNPGVYLRAVASSGTRVVAVGDSTLVSPDGGLTWTSGTASYRAVAWSKPLRLFVAIGSGGRPATSADGLTWAPAADSATTNGFNLNSVTWAGDRFVAVGEKGTIVGSRDGAHWNVESSGLTVNKVAWARDRFFAFGAGRVWNSPDGRDWTQYSMGSDQWANVASSGDRFIIVGSSSAWSSDGMNWSPHQSQPGGSQCQGIVWTGAQFVVVCSNNSAGRSADGVTWEPSKIKNDEVVPSYCCSDVAWTGSRFVAVGDRDTVAVSPDGATWTVGTPLAGADLRAVAWSGQRVVVVGGNGVAASSPDGLVWTTGETGTKNTLSAVTWASGRFVAVGQAQTILESADGLTWSRFSGPEGPFVWLQDIAAGAGRMVIVGEAGLIMAF